MWPKTRPCFLNHEGEPINFHTWRAKTWYRALRAKEIRVRKPYTMRHTFISVGLTQRRQDKVAGGVLWNVGGDDRKALWEVPRRTTLKSN